MPLMQSYPEPTRGLEYLLQFLQVFAVPPLNHLIGSIVKPRILQEAAVAGTKEVCVIAGTQEECPNVQPVLDVRFEAFDVSSRRPKLEISDWHDMNWLPWQALGLELAWDCIDYLQTVALLYIVILPLNCLYALHWGKGGLRLVTRHFDQGKPDLSQLVPETLLEEARVFDFGAVKYGRDNWKDGTEWHRVFASLMRHALAFWGGEDLDPESGLHHLAHVRVNSAFLMYWQAHERGTDDRS